MQATIDATAIADATEEQLVSIEGNWYFPPETVRDGALVKSPTAYTCPWKGPAQYFDVVVEGKTHKDAAWSYPTLKDSAVERVGTDFANYVAFDKSQVTVG